jgi:Cytochrome C oxidase, cbb3-type, subunit III
MWRKILGYGLGAAILLTTFGFTYLYFQKPATAPPSSIKIEISAARLARGEYLFRHIAACNDCHSERDFSRFGGPAIHGREGAGFVFPPELGLPGAVVAPNITPDKETGVGNWTDGEIIRAIREGIGRDGQALFPLMPYTDFRHISDEDVFAIVAYMKTLRPLKNALPRSRIDFPVSMLIKKLPQPLGQVPSVDQQNSLKYGEYLVTLAGCRNCHTPMERGQPAPNKLLAGGQLFRTSAGTAVSANITPDKDTGIGNWSEQDFLNEFYQYRKYADQGSPKVGPEGFTVMPWLSFCQMLEEDLKAIYCFLKSQPAVYHPVESHPRTFNQSKTFLGTRPQRRISSARDSNDRPDLRLAKRDAVVHAVAKLLGEN